MTEETTTNSKQVRGSINVTSTSFSLHMYCNTHTAWPDCGLSSVVQAQLAWKVLRVTT